MAILLVEEIIVEFGKGIGRFFLHPVTYYLVFFAIMVGSLRVKRERQDFHIRVLDLFEELRKLFPKGILVGCILSIFILFIGITLPIGAVILLGMMTVLCSFTFKLRWMSPAYVVGLTIFAIMLCQRFPLPFISNHLENTSLPAIAVLLGLLILSEGWLAFYSREKETTPVRIKSKRGFLVGAHRANRLWLLPIFFLMPGDVIHLPFDWWPLLPFEEKGYSLILLPLAIGFSMTTHGMLPKEAIRNISIQTIWLGILTTVVALASIWMPILSILAACIAIIGHGVILLRHRLKEDSMPFYYSKRENGLVILGILPSSPAEKMSLKIGEVIVKVNGSPIKTTEEFYLALQKNRAYCKLEVLDTNGENRLTGRTLYEGEHHELGILFASDEKKWENIVV